MGGIPNKGKVAASHQGGKSTCSSLGDLGWLCIQLTLLASLGPSSCVLVRRAVSRRAYALCSVPQRRRGSSWLQTLSWGPEAWWGRRRYPETSKNTWARHWAQSIPGTCPSSAPPWVDAGEEVLRWSGREERTYHLIVDRGGWWVVVGEQSCRDWPPVSQVIILEEKGDCRGERIWLGCGLPHQL